MKNKKIQLPSNKKFGFFFSVIFFFVAVFFLYKKQIFIGFAFFHIAFLFFFITIFKPTILFPLNKIWMQIGFFIGKIVNPIVLGFIFFGIFVPIGLLMKIFGRDELNLKFKPRNSYWKLKNTDKNNLSLFNNQF
jgi:hypothetical protein